MSNIAHPHPDPPPGPTQNAPAFCVGTRPLRASPCRGGGLGARLIVGNQRGADVVADEVVGGECLMARAAGFDRVRQVLVREAKGQGALAEGGKQPLHGFVQLWLCPVVADAVGEAVVAQQPLFVRVAVVVLLPLGGFGQHQRFCRRFDVRCGDFEFTRDVVQRVEGFAPGEGQRRADFEDGEVVAYQFFEGLRGLVVGGVRFKDGVREVVGDGGQRGGAFGR